MEPVEWRIGADAVEYDHAVAEMERRVAAIRAGDARELVWLLEHPALYTAGTSAKPEDLIEPARLPVHVTGRGGQYTYHGPGQRIAYVMLDLKARGGDIRASVGRLEEWLIAPLAVFAIRAARARCGGRDCPHASHTARPGCRQSPRPSSSGPESVPSRAP